MARWIFLAKKLENLKEFVTHSEKVAAMRAHHLQRFAEIEKLFTPGLRFGLKQETTGTASVVGLQEECLKLKQLVEEHELGTMIPGLGTAARK